MQSCKMFHIKTDDDSVVVFFFSWCVLQAVTISGNSENPTPYHQSESSFGSVTLTDT